MKEFKIKTRESYNENGVRSIEPIEASVIISEPTMQEPHNLKKEDVWGNGIPDKNGNINKGMKAAIYNQVCPVWGDIVPYKSTTFICPRNKENEVIYWIEYVYGCDCISNRKELDDLRVALRADYQYW